ncbi:ATPase family AAA domain-containing protein 2 isoform X2 [Nematostella vectensis]|nr:ATPase family AAA domain-containing protein 2 isoform X2 [Nematostella vectensis]
MHRRGRGRAPPHASPIRQYRAPKRKAMNMSSSTSSEESCDEQDERMFERRKSKSMAKARNRALPINLTIEDISKGVLRDRERIGSSLADVDPMSVDRKVKFDSVGGLNKQIQALKEMILFPLVYPEVFDKFKITPPRGVLFFGPPGTGKTLVARALANECSQGDKKVSFFMRKGADCLSKWVGESERQLRLLFDQAYAMRPSIIFFDEIDGLAPVRSSRQDQIHSSIVSTLLALMDGLDSRGEVVIIGATNRIDAIDPALRRPGRFDREFQFALPDRDARRSILSIHTREWEPRLSQRFISELADYCVGYCGADIKALCTEAALCALRRRYPQVYTSSRKLLLDINDIEITFKDFINATKSIVPAHQRSVASPARVLSTTIRPLLENTFNKAHQMLVKQFPAAQMDTGNASSTQQKHQEIPSDDDLSSDGEDGPDIYDHTHPTSSIAGSSRSERYMRRIMQRHGVCPDVSPGASKTFSFSEQVFRGAVTYRPRMLLSGREGMGQSTHMAPALLHSTEHLSVHCLDLPALYGVTSRTPEEACAQLFREARRSLPCIVYMPHLNSLWLATSESLHATLISLLQDLPPLSPVLLLATADKEFSQLPYELQQLFSQDTGQVLEVAYPNAEERRAFFCAIFLDYALQMPKRKKKRRDHSNEVLPFAPSPPSRQLSEQEKQKIQQNEESTMRELRIFLRDVHHKLIMDRRFKEFSKPVDLEEVEDYLDVIQEPMDLSTMMEKIDRHQYSTCANYLLDIDLITSNALKYNPDRDPLDKIIRHRACELRDFAHSLIKSQLEPEFEKACEEIVESRQRRGENLSSVAPAYVFTAPRTKLIVPPSSSNVPLNESVTPMSVGESSAGSSRMETRSASHSSSTGKNTDSSGKASKKKKRPYGGRRRRIKRRQLSKELNIAGKEGEEKDKNVNEEDEDVEQHYESMDTNQAETVDKGEEGDGNEIERETDYKKKRDENNATDVDRIEQNTTADGTNENDTADGCKVIADNATDVDRIEQNTTADGTNENDTADGNNVEANEVMARDKAGDSVFGSTSEKDEKDDEISRSGPTPLEISKDSVINQNGDIPVNHTDADIDVTEGKGKHKSQVLIENGEMYKSTVEEDSMVNNQADGFDPPSPNREVKTKKCVQFAEEIELPNGFIASDAQERIRVTQGSETLEKMDNKRLDSEVTECSLDVEEPYQADPSQESQLLWKQKLELLLAWLVDMTEGSAVASLEQCHSSLQQCVYQHRRDADKTVLIQSLEDILTGWASRMPYTTR